jgi:beta-RFAP synthase
MGFLDLSGASGRRFGSIGMALDAPQTRVILRRAPHTRVDGEEQSRAARHLETLQRALDIRGHFALLVERAIPAHAGLGSGTQLALCIAAALRRLHDLPSDLEGDAARLGRGRRSGIGIALFRSGGFVVDGGRGPATPIPPLLTRVKVPPQWRVLLLLDRTHRGLSGEAEVAAFADLPPMPATTADRICRLVLMQALPALAEADLPAFGAAITEVQAITGDYFAPAQDGARFASPRVAAALQVLADAGAHGIGQSSWGPTGFAFAAEKDEAKRLAAQVEALVEGLDIRICRGLNRGAALAISHGQGAPGWAGADRAAE